MIQALLEGDGGPARVDEIHGGLGSSGVSDTESVGGSDASGEAEPESVPELDVEHEGFGASSSHPSSIPRVGHSGGVVDVQLTCMGHEEHSTFLANCLRLPWTSQVARRFNARRRVRCHGFCTAILCGLARSTPSPAG